MQGSIQNARIQIKPSQALIDFIGKLDECNVMPKNVLEIYKAHGKTGPNEIHSEYIPKKLFTKKHHEVLKSIMAKRDYSQEYCDIQNLLDSIQQEESDDTDGDDAENKDNISSEANSKSDASTIVKNPANNKKKSKRKYECLFLEINDLRWIDQILEQRRSVQKADDYLHELLVDAKIVLPKNEIIPRNPVLEARCERLREEQKTREYRNMTKNVDATRQHLPEDTIAYQIKSINRQLIAVAQFIFSVLAGFAFGFQGLQYMFGNLDFGFRLFMGIICALIIALAEIYFLAKKLNEYDEVIEDIPMPPRQSRPHQD